MTEEALQRTAGRHSVWVLVAATWGLAWGLAGGGTCRGASRRHTHASEEHSQQGTIHPS
jgi:hypothetical protein